MHNHLTVCEMYGADLGLGAAPLIVCSTDLIRVIHTLMEVDMGSGCPVCCARPGGPSFLEDMVVLAFASRPSAG